MTFYTFMTGNYKSSDSPAGDARPAGDLARDMQSDCEKFPQNRPCKFKGWHKIIYDYLVRNGACDACLETFEECWKEYVQCEKKKLKRN